jgi:hypothetical protein
MRALDFGSARWRKSSHSTDQANCIEVAIVAGTVAVRDSKNLAGSVLAVPLPACTAFTTAARAVELG